MSSSDDDEVPLAVPLAPGAAAAPAGGSDSAQAPQAAMAAAAAAGAAAAAAATEPPPQVQPVPVMLITGFLGSGKTTLVSRRRLRFRGQACQPWELLELPFYVDVPVPSASLAPGRHICPAR